MKKLLAILAICIATTGSYAQNITDALRYSTENITGTARFRAMGGAFGALGGDLSAVGINPAGGAVFSNSHVSFSLSNDNINNDVNYFGSTTNTSDADVSFNQLGGIYVWENVNNSKWSKFSLGVTYDRTQNFDDRFVASGTGDTSISDYFLNFAQGVPLDFLELRPDETIEGLYQFLGEDQGFGVQQAFLGFQSFVIDPVDFDNPDNTTYLSNVSGESFDQEYAFASSGYNGKTSFNIAAEYDKQLYLGLNLNAHFLDYEQSTILNERSNDPNSFVKEVQFANNLRTFGNGFSFQLGGICKIGDVRLGASYQSPSWLIISEENSQSIRTVAEDDQGAFTTIVDPNTINVFQDYRLKTPGNYTGSFAYLFGTQGLISVDYSYTDYSNITFRPEGDPAFQTQNQSINDNLRGASTIRLGGEYRISKWSLRGGYRYAESPYENGETVGDLTGYSVGVGYNFGNIKLDMAFDQSSQERSQSLYSTGLTSGAQIDNTNTAVVATLSFSLN